MRKSKRNPVTVRGPWFAMPIEFLQSRAFASLSPTAAKLLFDLCSQLGANSKGNGDLSCTPSHMQPRGWNSTSTLRAALDELVGANLLVVTRHGNRRKCSLYAVTLWPMDCDFAKLDERPGCYTTLEWMHGKQAEPPTAESPAIWNQVRKNEPRKVPRKNANSYPAAGQLKRVMHPLRDNPTSLQESYPPAAGA